jgi:hypothetical protein
MTTDAEAVGVKRRLVIPGPNRTLEIEVRNTDHAVVKVTTRTKSAGFTLDHNERRKVARFLGEDE